MSDNQGVDVVILGSAHPLRGGLANYNHRLAQAYRQQGKSVKIITFSLQYPSFLFPGKTQYSDEPPPEGLDIAVELNSVNPLSWIKVGRMIKKLKPGLLIIKFWIPFMGPSLGTVARIARKNGFTKVVSIIDNIIPHEKRPGDKALAAYFVKYVDGFITMSESVMSDLKTFTTSKPAIFTPHPVYDNFGAIVQKDQARSRLGLDENGRYILFFGFIRDYKGLDLLLLAMADERVRALGIRAIVAGEFYTERAPYDKIIEENNLGDSLVMATDFIPDSKVGLYFSAADLVVQPYKDATQSGVTQVAYSFEKPMVVTNVGGLAEIVPHGKAGYVVDVDVKEIASAIVDFYSGNREAEMVSFCRQEKKKYSWETLLDKINELRTN
jgi:glycosyltransferase involved in cell wall biosynthesis